MKGMLKKCPNCGGSGNKTDWEPKPGNDPFMRQYHCQSCGVLFYGLLTMEQREAVYDEKTDEVYKP